MSAARPLRHLGRRRGWLAAIQPLLTAAAALLALSDPAYLPALSLAAAALVAFLSASQDIVVDAWRIEAFPQHRQGAALAAYIWGYRVAVLLAGAGVIYAVGVVGWHLALLGAAGLIGLGLVITLLAPEPPPRATRPAADFASRLAHAVIEPLRDFLTRRGAVLILAFVALFRLGEAMAGIMTQPFYLALGFSAGDRLEQLLLAWRHAGRLRAWRLDGGAHRYRAGAVVDRLDADDRHGDVSAARAFGGRTLRAVCDGHYRGVRAGHGRRGVHHLPLRPLFARVHRNALCAAVVAVLDRDPHDRRRVGRAGCAGGVGGVLCAVHVRRFTVDGADACVAAAIPA